MLAEFSIVPLDKGADSLSVHVAQILAIVRESGLDYQLTAMGTIVEGDSDKVFSLLKQCHLAMTAVSSRVSTSIKIDDRRGAKGRLTGKIRSVEAILHDLPKPPR